MKKITYSIIFLVLGTCICAQTKFDEFEKNIIVGDSLYKIPNYSVALRYYTKAFDLIPTESDVHYFRAATCAFFLEDINTCQELIRAAIVKAGAHKEFLFAFPGFSDLRCLDFFETIVSEYDSLRLEHFCNYRDPESHFEINRLVAKDQLVREIAIDIKQFGINNRINQPSVDSNLNIYLNQLANHLIFKVDSINSVELKAVTEKYGFQKDAWLLLWHKRYELNDEDSEYWKYYKMKINEEVEKGELSRNYIKEFYWLEDIFENIN